MAERIHEEDTDIWEYIIPRRTPTPPPNAAIKSSNLSKSKFLSLPTEIRFSIYSFCLISSSTIVVWSAEYYRATLGAPYPPRRLRWNREAMVSSTRDLALGLLRCSTTVAAESARVFYEGNVFRFCGDHEYYPVITWLDKIAQNRKFLERLEISVRRPNKAWQMPDGTRHRELGEPSDYTFIGSVLRHPHFAPQPYLEGQVDVIDPAVETIISSLAKPGSGRKMTLYMDTGYYNIPGIELIVQEGTSLFSMDLPNLVETWRTSYFSDASFGSLDIVWKAEVGRDDFHNKRTLIEQVGWKIFNEQEAQRIYNPFSRPGDDRVSPTMRFSMRRNQLTSPLMAADIDPYTDWYRKPLDEDRIME
ncbi:MAG: hypothetical protein Q9208_007366 [Pyrenodesmia sp. 3 TL-2023]